MTCHRRVGSRAPLLALAAALLALLLLPALAIGADWTSLKRVTDVSGSRLDSLHQLAGDNGKLHLVHPRIGSGATDDRVIYQRSTDDGKSWSKERTIFRATSKHRHVVPNLALDARGQTVAVAWRVGGPSGTSLFVRLSHDGGKSFEPRQTAFFTSRDAGIGVPAVAVGNDFVAVAWTNRNTGKVKVRLSRNGGRTWKPDVTIGDTRLSIDCGAKLTDGLVGLAAAGTKLHAAWSYAEKRSCLASSIKVRTSVDRGASWERRRSLTDRRSYGWPELDARGKTVMATVQSPSGGVIVARSTKNGRKWSDRLLKPAAGHNLSAADVVLLPKGKAMLVYTDEVLKSERLARTKVVSRRSPNDGGKWNAPKVVAGTEQKLRLAANIATDGKQIAVVVQSGQLDGKPRNLFASRLR